MATIEQVAQVRDLEREKEIGGPFNESVDGIVTFGFLAGQTRYVLREARRRLDGDLRTTSDIDRRSKLQYVIYLCQQLLEEDEWV